MGDVNPVFPQPSSVKEFLQQGSQYGIEQTQTITTRVYEPDYHLNPGNLDGRTTFKFMPDGIWTDALFTGFMSVGAQTLGTVNPAVLPNQYLKTTTSNTIGAFKAEYVQGIGVLANLKSIEIRKGGSLLVGYSEFNRFLKMQFSTRTMMQRQGYDRYFFRSATLWGASRKDFAINASLPDDPLFAQSTFLAAQYHHFNLRHLKEALPNAGDVAHSLRNEGSTFLNANTADIFDPVVTCDNVQGVGSVMFGFRLKDLIPAFSDPIPCFASTDGGLITIDFIWHKTPKIYVQNMIGANNDRYGSPIYQGAFNIHDMKLYVDVLLLPSASMNKLYQALQSPNAKMNIWNLQDYMVVKKSVAAGDDEVDHLIRAAGKKVHSVFVQNIYAGADFTPIPPTVVGANSLAYRNSDLVSGFGSTFTFNVVVNDIQKFSVDEGNKAAMFKLFSDALGKPVYLGPTQYLDTDGSQIAFVIPTSNNDSVKPIHRNASGPCQQFIGLRLETPIAQNGIKFQLKGLQNVASTLIFFVTFSKLVTFTPVAPNIVVI